MNRQGFTLLEIMIVVAIVGLLAMIAIPSFMKSRRVSQAHACINNMRQIDSGKEQAAMTMGWMDGEVVDENIVNDYIRGGSPECPVEASGPYDYGFVSERPICGSTPNTAARRRDGTDHWVEGLDEGS